MNISTIESILLALLVLDAIALTVLVLLQQGKGADVGAAFGSGSSNTMFGSLGAASFFTKATAWLAIGFFVITFCLAYVAKERANQLGTVGIPSATESLPKESSSEMAEPVAPEDAGVGDVPGVEEDTGDVPGL
ncbi:MAG: preprotein translocase subunit SecG [Pseudomonadota bacterium]|nr:preprotein translocase subunit SecG [Pseudomonadota bacterium]